MENRVKIDISTISILKVVAVILGLWFLYAIRDVAVLFFIVLVIVAALGPLVDRMSKHIPRLLSVIILSLIFLGVLAAFGFLLIPPIVAEIKLLAINLPIIAERYGPIYQTIQNSIGVYQQSLINASSQLGQIGGGIYSTTIGFFSGLVAFVTILVLSVYMLLEQDSIKNLLGQIIPSEKKERLFPVLQKISVKMGSWLRGQFVLMLLIGILDGVALTALGVPYALVLAFWGGLTEIIPYVGPWLGLVPAAIIAFTISPLTGLLVIIAYVVIQQLEAHFLAPKIMSKAVGLSPVIIILSLLIGAKLFGLLGVVIAVPVAGALSVLVRDWAEIRSLYR
jgi:predicted PurR-regulated permease PerM